jgi:hypothetical protein
MQKHHVDVTKRIELTPAISAKSDQGEWNPGCLVSAGSIRSSTEDVLQQNINQLSTPGANFAATPARLVLQAQPMLFNLEKFFVKGEDFGWACGTRGREAAFRVRQNLLEVSGRPHHEFRLLLKSKIGNSKSKIAISPGEGRSASDDLPFPWQDRLIPW